jgi:hypothetical protein
VAGDQQTQRLPLAWPVAVCCCKHGGQQGRHSSPLQVKLVSCRHGVPWEDQRQAVPGPGLLHTTGPRQERVLLQQTTRLQQLCGRQRRQQRLLQDRHPYLACTRRRSTTARGSAGVWWWRRTADTHGCNDCDIDNSWAYILLLLCLLLCCCVCSSAAVAASGSQATFGGYTCSPGDAASRAAHASHCPDMSDRGKATAKQLAPPADVTAAGAPMSDTVQVAAEGAGVGAACGHKGSCRHSPAGLTEELPSAGAVHRCSWRPAALLLLMAASANPPSAGTRSKESVCWGG